jgi:hypothetical protein
MSAINSSEGPSREYQQTKEQIKNWADKEMIEPKVTFEADDIIEHYGDFLITSLTDGNYDKSQT